MPPALIIACLSQKGGVGKSTLARLVARTYADAGWNVKIADFNTKQKTSVDWAAMRMEANITPSVAAEPFSSTKQALKQDVDLLVLDGRPDSDTTSLDCAKIADLVLIPTGEALDDLKPQVLFAHELKSRGIPTNKLLFVVNNAKSDISVSDAQRYINEANFSSTENSLGARTGYTIAQNRGLAVSETSYPSLNERADILASEIVEKATQLSRSSI